MSDTMNEVETAVERTLVIESPYKRNMIEQFDKNDFSDCPFVIPGIEKPLNLHRMILCLASPLFNSVLAHDGTSLYCKYDKDNHRAQWLF